MCTYDVNYRSLHSLKVGKLEKLSVYQILICPTVSNEDLEAVIASLRASTTKSKAILVACPLLKSDWLLSRRLFCVRKAETWLNTTSSSVFAMKGRMKPGM